MPYNFRNNHERRIYAALQSQGDVASYEPVALPYVLNHTYTPDFLLPSGILCELKSYFSQRDRAKMLAIRCQYPDLDIRLVFADPTRRISRISKTSYSEWATRHGFIWCHGHIPADWF